MASVMDYLLDALPVAAAANRVPNRAGLGARRANLVQASAAELRPWLRYLEPGESAEAFPAPVLATSFAYAKERFPLIWYLAAGARPNQVGAGAVRVKEARLASHLVFESIEWGHYEGERFVPSVNVTTDEGLGVDLPLEDEFLYAQLWTRGTHMIEAGHHLHPLALPVDTGLVRAFVYELTPQGKVTPLDAERMAAEEAEDWLETLEAFEALRKGEVGADPGCGERLFRHQVLPDPSTDARSGAIGDAAVRVRAVGHRFIVTISLTLSRDIFDFEPGGVLAAARIHPHVHVASSLRCQGMDVACRITRPRRTTLLTQFGQDGADPSAPSCHDMHQEIRNLLVADTAEVDLLCHDAPVGGGFPHGPFGHAQVLVGPLPMWGNLFSYYAADASERFPGRVFEVVPRDPRRTRTRAIRGAIERLAPDLLAPMPPEKDRSFITTKLPSQGEFDNVHVAPRMILQATHARRWGFSPHGLMGLVPAPITGWLPLAGTNVVLDPIVMAPLCAHDCFHLHWRWSDANSRKSVFGWNEAGPYARAGAPMIPINHSLALRLPARNVVALSERARDVPPGTQQVFFHFGAAYGLAADGLRRQSMYSPSPTAGANMTSTVEFGVLQPDGETIEPIPANNWSAMYWNFRYRMRGDAQSGARAEEYHTHHDLLRAMEA